MNNKTSTDLRKVSPDVRNHLRQQVIRLYKEGMKTMKICCALDVKRSFVWETVRAYEEEGKKALTEKTRGRRNGDKRLLSPAQEREIQRIIIDKCPDQMKLACALWTREAIRQLIIRKYGIDIKVRSISNYLDRWGMTCQRPKKKGYFQDDVKLKEFMDNTYPDIVKKAKKEDAEIYWGDETGINNQEYHIRGFALKGKTPTVASFSKVEKVNMISAINNYGTCRFMCYDENMTQQRFIEFMRRLVRECDRKVLFIVDNLKVHHGKIVQKWLVDHVDEIELFYTSPYSPEINPDEYLNHNLKQSVHSGLLPKTRDDIKKKVHSFMKDLQHNSEKVKNLFNHKNLEYIRQYGY